MIPWESWVNWETAQGNIWNSGNILCLQQNILRDNSSKPEDYTQLNYQSRIKAVWSHLYLFYAPKFISYAPIFRKLYVPCGSGHSGAYFSKTKQIETLDRYMLQYANHTSISWLFKKDTIQRMRKTSPWLGRDVCNAYTRWSAEARLYHFFPVLCSKHHNKSCGVFISWELVHAIN